MVMVVATATGLAALLLLLLSSNSGSSNSMRRKTQMEDHDMLDLDARTLSSRLQAREIAAVQLMAATLNRLDRINPTYNAVVLQRDREQLLEEALRADEANDRKGWLHGIPIAIKDLSNVKGVATTMGGSPLCDPSAPSRFSDPFVQRMIDAGCIIIGKTNTPESGLGSHTYNRVFGTTLNSYDHTRSAGGSSGGAAVALANRILCLADGSDMMGSLRNPAGWNNLYSIRPTAGMLEYLPLDRNPLPFPISTNGPMARTVHDLALLLETMAPPCSSGNDDSIIFQAPAWAKKETDTFRSSKVFRVLWLGDWHGALPVEEGILDICHSALQTALEPIGHEIVRSREPLFSLDELWKSWTTIRSAVVAEIELSLHDYKTILEKGVREELQWEICRGLETSDSDLQKAGVVAHSWSAKLETIFDDYDAIALPSAQCWPFPASWKYPEAITGRNLDTYHRWMEVVVPVSLAGLPCVTVPAGFGGRGGKLPMGIQLAGRRGDDAELLELAQVYHEATDWPSRQPAPSCDHY